MLHLFESITEDTVTVLVIFFVLLLEVGAPLSQITININLKIVFLF